MKLQNFESIIKFIQKNGSNRSMITKKSSEFEKNFLECLELCNDKQIVHILLEMSKYTNFKYILRNNSVNLSESQIKYAFEITQEMSCEERYNSIKSIIESSSGHYSEARFLDNLISYGETEYISDNLEQIIKLVPIKQLISKKSYLSKLKDINLEKFAASHSLIVSKIASHAAYNKKNTIDAKTVNALSLIFEEIAENENTDLSEIQFLKSGHFSQAYKLGNKVIKLGRPKYTYKIPYHKRLLQPLIRRDILPENLYIEITEYLKPGKPITEEDVYSVYKSLRDDGILWLDPSPENLARLEKDNIIHFKYKLNVEDESLGYTPSNSKKGQVLSKGDLVVIDLDFLIEENDKETFDKASKSINTTAYKKYERRYQKEKKEDKSKEIEI